MKNYFYGIISLFVLGMLLTSCSDKRQRQVQYMPDMYMPVPYEAYAEADVFPYDMEAQLPVEGTIARGHHVYDYPNTNEGYEAAKADLKDPLEISEKNAEKGQMLYGMYCVVCHGKKGDGQGDLVKNEKFLGIPNYKDRDITEGSIYHVLMYGKGLMGSHSSQLTYDERWQIVQHVQTLRNELLK